MRAHDETTSGGGTPRELLRDDATAIYRELRQLAAACFRGRRGHTLQPTALVHEALLRLRGADSGVEFSQRQYFALAARAMRQILVDHARARGRRKRGGGIRPVALDESDAPVTAIDLDSDLLDLESALTEMASLDPRQAAIVELRFFGGLEMQEVAAVVGISLSTAEREWRAAKAWLGQRLAAR
jgi:RNA polymerase sigma factor (TIGR02999 family)